MTLIHTPGMSVTGPGATLKVTILTASHNPMTSRRISILDHERVYTLDSLQSGQQNFSSATTRHVVTVTRRSKVFKPFRDLWSLHPYTHPLVSRAPGPGSASGSQPALLHARSSPSRPQPPFGFYASTTSLGRSNMLPSHLPSRPRTAPRLHDSDHTIQFLYGPVPTRPGSDHPAPVRPSAYTTRI